MKFDSVAAGLGVFVSCFVYFVGGLDSLTIAVLAAILFDYTLAVLVAISEGKKRGSSLINSQVGFKGIIKKLVLVACIAFAHILDSTIAANAPIFKTGFCVLFLGNECLSLTKHLKYFGVPIPQMFIDSTTKWIDTGQNKTDTSQKI